MLAYDLKRTLQDTYEMIFVDRNECDITQFESVKNCIWNYKPDIVLNCAAYTAVDDAEDIGRKMCYEVNALGSYHLAKAAMQVGIDLINISTDYVFDGEKKEGYTPNDTCNPIWVYGMSKYLGEKMTLNEHPDAIIIRTSWLYGWEVYRSENGVYKNFVNTMLRLSENRSELKVVADQYGIPTSCVSLSQAISQVIEMRELYRWKILHFSNSCLQKWVTWADFARKIFEITQRNVVVQNCATAEYPTKAKRPASSILINTESIQLEDWEEALRRYLSWN